MQEISSIDALLTGTVQSNQEVNGNQPEEINYDYEESPKDNADLPDNSNEREDDASRGQDTVQPEEEEDSQSDAMDDYGNKKSPENEVIRERLRKQAESLERKHRTEIESLRQQLTSNQSQQVKEASKDFEYNPDSGENWQQQLASFIKQTVSHMTYEQQESQTRAKEQQIQAQFEDKFRQGMGNFEDYVDVVGAQPITDAMTIATRNMQDPAAFLYAASKRAPQELDRIAKMSDAYAQIMEMGKLEERMRKTRSHTSAPKPLSKFQSDMSVPHKSEKTLSGDDLLAQSDARKRAQMKNGKR